MSAKFAALKDIQDDLKTSRKCFIPFRSELNPVMSQLVHEHLKAQGFPQRPKTQLVAHCFFCKATNEVQFNNYQKYYGKV